MANENFLGGRLRIFSQLHKEYMKPYMIENDISYNQYFYLNTINAIPGVNQNFLVEVFRSKKSLVSITLKDLEDKSLITQKPDPNNRRSYIINITPKGKDMVEYLNIHDKRCEAKIKKLFEFSDIKLQQNVAKVREYIFDDSIDSEDLEI